MQKYYAILAFAATFLSLHLCTASDRRKYDPTAYLSVYENVISEEKMRRTILYLSDDNARGRATGSRGHETINSHIRYSFKKYELKPFFGDYYTQRFMCKDSVVATNIAGYVPSITGSDEYIIISAHYDHIGDINGFIYNGADDNASGVAVMMNLAEVFSLMSRLGSGPSKNLVFIAFDAKEKSMAGSRHFVEHLQIPKEKIIADINIDQIGTVLEPVQKNDTNYVLVLGKNTLRKKDRGKIDYANRNTGLNISYTYYGSPEFTQVFMRVSDQIAFLEKDIPALFVTSGIHRHTYKTTDDECLINYPVLKKRALLLFNLLMIL